MADGMGTKNCRKNATLQVGDTIVIREGYATRQDFHTLWLQGLSSYLSQPQGCHAKVKGKRVR